MLPTSKSAFWLPYYKHTAASGTERLICTPTDLYSRYHAQFVDRASDATPLATNIRSNLRDLTMKPHIAGSLNDLETAECAAAQS